VTKLTRVAIWADDGGELVGASDAHSDAHRIVDVLDELGRVFAARPCAGVEQQEHVVA
jgi:hypothetical protein